MWQLFQVVVGLAVLAAVTTLRARRRRRAMSAGKAVRLGARVRGTGRRYPSRWTAGALVIEGEHVGWSPRGTDDVLGLGSAGLDVLGVRPRRAREWSLNENALVISARDRSGASLELAVHEVEFDNALAVLRAAKEDPDGAVDQLQADRWARVPVAAAAVLSVAAVLTALLGYLYAAGRTTDATVTKYYDEGVCSITWSDPWDGRSHRAAVDCAESSQPGTAVRIVALPTPFRGEAFDLYDSHYFSGGALAVLWLSGLGGIAVRARSRRADLTGRQDLTTNASGPVVALTPEDVSFQAVVAAVRSRRGPVSPTPRRVPAVGQEESWWRIPVLRGFVTGGLLRALGGAVVLAFALLIGSSWWSAAWHLSRDDTAVTTAKVDDWVEGMLPLFPHDLYALISLDGREVEALVATADLPDEPPATVQVRYSTSHPSAAELVRGSALTRGVVLSAAAAAGALGWLLWVGLCTTRDVRRLRQASRSSGGTTFRFVATTDIGGDGALVLYDIVPDQPRWLLFLTGSELERLADSGELRLLGDLREDGVVVAKYGSDTIWPNATLLPAEPELLCEVVNGLPLDDAA